MAETALSSPELLRRLATSRDGAAWSELIDRHGADVFRMTRRILPDEALAEDACQGDRCCNCASMPASSASPPGAVDADDCVRRWIVRIAANTALMTLRKRLRDDRGVTMAHKNPEPEAPDEAAQRSQMLSRIHHDLAELPELLRSAVLLRFYANFDYTEMAAELRCSVGTAKARVSRGLAQLRTRAAIGGLVLSIGALETLLEPQATGVTNAGVDASRAAQWKQLIDSNRTPSINGLPAKGLSLMAKLSIASAGVLVVAFVAATQWQGRAADSVAGGASTENAPGANPTVAQAPQDAGKTRANPNGYPVIGPKAPEAGKESTAGANLTPGDPMKAKSAESTDAGAKDAEPAKPTTAAGKRAALEAAIKEIVAGTVNFAGLIVAVTHDHPAGPNTIVNADSLGNVWLNGSGPRRKMSKEEVIDFLKIVSADVADLPDATIPMNKDTNKGRLSFFLNGLNMTVTVTNNWKNCDAFWQAVDGLSAKKDPPPTQNVALNDSLKSIADGKLPAADLECSAIYTTAESMPKPIKIGDEAQNSGVSIRKGVVTVQITTVIALRSFGPASVPTYQSKPVVVDATEAELRQVAGLLAEIGLTNAKRGFAYIANTQKIRLDAVVDGQEGSVELDLANEADAKRAEKLITLLKEFRSRAVKK